MQDIQATLKRKQYWNYFSNQVLPFSGKFSGGKNHDSFHSRKNSSLNVLLHLWIYVYNTDPFKFLQVKSIEFYFQCAITLNATINFTHFVLYPFIHSEEPQQSFSPWLGYSETPGFLRVVVSLIEDLLPGEHHLQPLVPQHILGCLHTMHLHVFVNTGLHPIFFVHLS